jgi:hypothetical protein
MLRTLDRDVIAQALLDSDVTSTPVGPDGLLAHAEAAQVGKIASTAGVPLLELRPADGDLAAFSPTATREDLYADSWPGQSPSAMTFGQRRLRPI